MILVHRFYVYQSIVDFHWLVSLTMVQMLVVLGLQLETARGPSGTFCCPED